MMGLTTEIIAQNVKPAQERIKINPFNALSFAGNLQNDFRNVKWFEWNIPESGRVDKYLKKWACITFFM